jgi:phenylalanyl-tRNA synthetase beta chain
MICNSDEGMCIAGVFGGLKSGVTEATTDLFLESATFSPVSIRRTSRRHDLRTEASYRFERGTDPEMTLYALRRAAMLVRELAGGVITGDVVDIYPAPVRKAVVRYSLDRMTRLIGKEIPVETVKTILYSLDMHITAEEPGYLTVEIPTYRVDVTREADITEEVLRIYGYDNIGISSEMHSMLSHTEKPDREKVAANMSDMLAANGFAEIMCNSPHLRPGLRQRATSIYRKWSGWPILSAVTLTSCACRSCRGCSIRYPGTSTGRTAT